MKESIKSINVKKVLTAEQTLLLANLCDQAIKSDKGCMMFFYNGKPFLLKKMY